MHSKKTDVFETMTLQLENEFAQHSRIHADWEFVLTDKKTREVKNVKKFRILAILNDVEEYKHIGVIIPELSNEYVQLPDLVEKFLLDIQKNIEKNVCDPSNNGKTLDVSVYRFTRNVYLYTDKLLVSEDVLKKHFQDHNLLLQIRMAKRNLSL
jgi:Na+/phosphate symporter